MPSLYEASPSPSPVCGGGQRGGSLRQQQGVPAVPFGNESCPENLEPCVRQPDQICLSVGMAPAHRCAMPVLLGSGPGTSAHGRQQVPARSEPAAKLLKEFGLLCNRDVNDGKERHDGTKALGLEIAVCYVLAEELGRRH